MCGSFKSSVLRARSLISRVSALQCAGWVSGADYKDKELDRHQGPMKPKDLESREQIRD